MNEAPWITLLTLTPLAGAVVVAGVDSGRKSLARGLALAFSLLGLAIAMGLWLGFDAAKGDLQFVEQHEWIPASAVRVDYFVGIDGLGLLMVLLSALLVPFAIAVSWTIPEQPKLHLSLVLVLESGLFGAFTALNFFHWFIFWELSLVPAYFLIKLWGGPQRVQAATQFFVYTMVGSVTMLLGFVALYAATGTFDFIELAQWGRSGGLEAALAAKLHATGMPGHSLLLLAFLGIFLGFAVKVPLVPFHTWLPAAYAEAPTGTTMILTGAMSKMGVYGFLRILLPIFPEQMRAVLTPLLWLVAASIVYSAFAAFAQRDLKRLLAYSSINHLGYCLLGIVAAARFTGTDAALASEKAAALTGAVLQMFNHGVTAAALFCFVGMLEARGEGARGVGDFGGLRRVAPVFCGLMGIATFASLGLPGLNGFVSEFLVFKGTFALAPWAAAASCAGLLVTAVFLLTMLQRVFHGPLNPRWAALPDLTAAERVLVFPVIVLMFAVGIFPQFVLEVLGATVGGMVDRLGF